MFFLIQSESAISILPVTLEEYLASSQKRFDYVVSSHLLCTVDDPAHALKLFQQALKPGGTYAFFDHVLNEKSSTISFLQKSMSPVFQVIGDGCHPDRDIKKVILAAGFDDVQVDEFDLVSFPFFVRSHIRGRASMSNL